MFACSKFNKDISKWDIGNIENMSCMFIGSEFNQDISNWDISKVKNISHMFNDYDEPKNLKVGIIYKK
jgi:hypothetical protein